jgi:hypothetical protein
VEPRSVVRDRIRAAGADERLGGINRFETIADVLDRDWVKEACSNVRPHHVAEVASAT